MERPPSEPSPLEQDLMASPVGSDAMPPPGPAPNDDAERCDWCGSTELWWRNCKLLCRSCHAIVKSCADL